MTMDPKSVKGVTHWMLLGAAGAMLALTLGRFFPAIIPAKAASQRL